MTQKINVKTNSQKKTKKFNFSMYKVSKQFNYDLKF